MHRLPNLNPGNAGNCDPVLGVGKPMWAQEQVVSKDPHGLEAEPKCCLGDIQVLGSQGLRLVSVSES